MEKSLFKREKAWSYIFLALLCSDDFSFEPNKVENCSFLFQFDLNQTDELTNLLNEEYIIATLR